MNQYFNITVFIRFYYNLDILFYRLLGGHLIIFDYSILLHIIILSYLLFYYFMTFLPHSFTLFILILLFR